jgi:hypothetical protein
MTAYDILLTDICNRLPYGLFVKEPNELEPIIYTYDYHPRIKNCIPYLRSLSTMTEEEYNSINWDNCAHTYMYSLSEGFKFISIETFTLEIQDWLNKNMFDYRGLIPMGLANVLDSKFYKNEC